MKEKTREKARQTEREKGDGDRERDVQRGWETWRGKGEERKGRKLKRSDREGAAREGETERIDR